MEMFKDLINNFPKLQQVDIVVTEMCTLNCSYCYVHKKAKSYMFKEMFLSCLDNLSDYLADSVSITLFGGEPLLNLECLYAVPEFRKKYPFISSVVVVTNGTLLTEEIMEFLQKNDIGISVSWDGNYETQKITRPLFNDKFLATDGLKTEDINYDFDKIAPLLRKYKNNFVKSMISPDNISKMIDNAIYFKEKGIYNIDFSIIRDNIWSKEDIKIFHTELEKLYFLYKENEWAKQGFRIGLFDLPIYDYLAMRKGNNRQYACFAGNTGCAIFPSGDIYPCTRFGTNGLNKLGNIKAGLHTTIEELNARNVMVNSRKRDYVSGCDKCLINSFCFLGCLYSQLTENGTVLAPINSICTLFKIISKFAFQLYQEDEYFAKFFERQGNN